MLDVFSLSSQVQLQSIWMQAKENGERKSTATPSPRREGKNEDF